MTLGPEETSLEVGEWNLVAKTSCHPPGQGGILVGALVLRRESDWWKPSWKRVA